MAEDRKAAGAMRVVTLLLWLVSTWFAIQTRIKPLYWLSVIGVGWTVRVLWLRMRRNAASPRRPRAS